MPVKYRLVKRKVTDLKGGPAVDKSFAQTVYNATIELEDVCELVSMRSSMSSADVKSIIDSLNYVLAFEMKKGNIVKLGEIGNFRPSVSSIGAGEGEEFSVATNMRKSRIVFTPGKLLQNMRSGLSYSEVEPVVVTEVCDKPHLE